MASSSTGMSTALPLTLRPIGVVMKVSSLRAARACAASAANATSPRRGAQWHGSAPAGLEHLVRVGARGLRDAAAAQHARDLLDTLLRRERLDAAHQAGARSEERRVGN